MTTFSLDTDPHTSPAMEAAAHAQASRRGFTLVEIMAATGIMIAVILLVLSLTTNVLNTWNFSSDQLAQNYEARIALDFLAQDLEAAVFRSNGMAWMEVRYENLNADATNQTQLYFFSPVTDRPRSGPAGTIAGDICAVAYLTEFQNPFTGSTTNRPQYGLYRAVVDAENTFNTALGQDDFIANDGSTHPTSEAWTDNSMEAVNESLAANVTVSEAWVRDSANYLSANVTNFQILFFYSTTNTLTGAEVIEAITEDRSASGEPRAFVVADGIYISDSPSALPGAGTTPEDGHLVYADIKMTVLGDEGANMVANGTWGDTGMAWDDFQLTYGQTFTRRVYIMSNPI